MVKARTFSGILGGLGIALTFQNPNYSNVSQAVATFSRILPLSLMAVAIIIEIFIWKNKKK